MSGLFNKRAFLVVIFLVLFGGLFAASGWMFNKITETVKSIASLGGQEQTLLLATKATEALIKVYKETLATMEKEDAKFPKDQVDFLSAVEQQLTDSGVEKISITTTGTNTEGSLLVNVEMKGLHYNVLRAISGWRIMPEIVKMKALSFKIDSDGIVEGSIQLETTLWKGAM